MPPPVPARRAPLPRMDSSPTTARQAGLHTSPQPSPREARAYAREEANKVTALIAKPWRGMADKLKGPQQRMLQEFEERGIRKRKMSEDGSLVDVVSTKFWVRWDGEESAEETTNLNITRMFNKLLKSRNCPEDVKEKIAQDMRNAAARDYLAKLETQRKQTGGADVNTEEAELQAAKLKAGRSQSSATAREEERQRSITQYVERDLPMQEGHFNLCLYLLTVTIMMCRLPFSFISNHYFRNFLKALRPTFEGKMGGKWIRERMAGPLLDEVYEEAMQVAAEKIDEKPGLLTLGIDGHKDGRNRTLETITMAKVGVSVFVTCEYMRTTRATGANLATLVKKHLTSPHKIIALVADNTSANMTMFEELQKARHLDAPPAIERPALQPYSDKYYCMPSCTGCITQSSVLPRLLCSCARPAC